MIGNDISLSWSLGPSSDGIVKPGSCSDAPMSSDRALLFTIGLASCFIDKQPAKDLVGDSPTQQSNGLLLRVARGHSAGHIRLALTAFAV